MTHNQQSLDSLIRREFRMKKYLITAAQAEARPNYQFMQSLETYAKKEKAEIIVLPLPGKSILEYELHEDIENHYRVVDNNLKINNNLRISNFKIRPQQINPLTGVKRFAHGDSSFVFASTKQVLQYVAVPHGRLAKAVMTTGAITHPNYNMNTRVGRIAYQDHEYGALLVEVESPTYFHFRHIKAHKNGKFSDLKGRYSGRKRLGNPNVEALIMGDLHPYDTNKKHLAATIEQIKELKPKYVILHDVFNGLSISHHHEGRLISKHEVYKRQGLDLDKELSYTVKAINKIADSTKGEVIIVRSNHDEHLLRYLEEGRFIGDDKNTLVGTELFYEAIQGKDPLEEGLYSRGLASNVRLLQRDDDFRIRGFQLGNHGDLGANGGRGSIRSIEEANGKSITGHGHSAWKIRDTIRVGTATNLRLDYNRGYSNWTNTNAVLYDMGTAQLINTIKGRWKA